MFGFKTKKVEKNPLLVKIVDDSERSISGTLGISDERVSELQKIIKKSLLNREQLTDTMEDISKEVKDANEFALGMFQFAAMYIDKVKDAEKIKDHIEEALKDLLKGKRNSEDE